MRFSELAEPRLETGRAEPARMQLGRLFSRGWHSEAASGYRFILLPLLLLALIKVYPFVYNFVLSVTDETLTFVGLAQFERILATESTVNALRNTIYLTALVVPLGTVLSLVAAIAVNERFRFRAVIRLGFILPMVTSIVVGSMVWELILLPRGGLLNSVIGTQGVHWLQTPNLAMPAVAVVITWSAVGLNMLVFLAALQDIDQDLVGAAIVDGASYIQRIWYVIIPSIKNVVLFVVATLTIMVFRSFGVIYVLTQGGPVQRTNTLVWEAYLSAFSYLRFNEAAAMAVLMVLVILLITAVYFRALRSSQ
jgi:ABC-type sugar transport system permease subunit